MDLSTIKPGGRKIEITHPRTGDPIGLRIGILSFDDPRLKAVRRKITDRKLYLDQRGKNFKADEVEDNGNEMLFGAMTEWEWYNPTGKPGDKDYNEAEMPSFKGEQPDFNRKNVMAIFDELSWIKTQIDTACAEEKDFFDK